MAFTTTYFASAYSSSRKTCVVLEKVDQFDEETQLTQVGYFAFDEDDWFGEQFEGIRATSIAYNIAKAPSYVVGDRGEIWTLDGDNTIKEQLPDSGLEGRGLGQPNEIRLIAGQPYVCGFAGQIYTQKKGKWVHMDDGVAEPEGTAESIDLESIDGTGPDDIYVVGSTGLVFHWNGRKWTRVPVVTNVNLARVRCFAKDHIVAVGDNGVVLESDGKRWKTERIPMAEETSLNDVALFKGKLYVAGVERLFVRNRSGWETVEHDLPKKKTSFVRLDTGDDRLWAMGWKRLNSFDGRRWYAHPDPNNG